MEDQSFHIDDPEHTAYNDPYNWGEKPEFTAEQKAQLSNDIHKVKPPETELEIITEAMRKYMGRMGQ